jgi:chorismate synthase
MSALFAEAESRPNSRRFVQTEVLRWPGRCRNFVYNEFPMVRFLTAGESHGRAIVAILEGIPSGLTVDFDRLTYELHRRQLGYGRGRRMQIESDRAEVIGGVRKGRTTGAPIALLIQNKDWENWRETMRAEPGSETDKSRAPISRPRPGHADLAGAIKYDHDDIRDVLERASARETAARVAAGAVARQFLAQLDIDLASHVTSIGAIALPRQSVPFEEIRAISGDSPLRCIDRAIESQMMAEIDRARDAGDTVGGIFEVIAHNLPIGLGSYVQWDRKLDGRLAQAIMSIHAVKAVGIGAGPEVARLPGSQVHDEIVLLGAEPDQIIGRPTNNAGGLEGGVTNGEDLRISGYMKPISTLMKPLRSVDLSTMTEAPATVERSDVCAVPAAGIVGEAMVALVLADAVTEKFGGDSLSETRDSVRAAGMRLLRRLQRGVGA